MTLEIVEFGGTGRPVVLLHGLMGRATTWWPIARELTRHGRVLGLDARGHGRSGRPRDGGGRCGFTGAPPSWRLAAPNFGGATTGFG